MKATDLRIGNWVYATTFGECEILGLHKAISDGLYYLYVISKFGGNVEERTVQIGYVRPIPLTEDWLVKLGFSDAYCPPGYIGYVVKEILNTLLKKPDNPNTLSHLSDEYYKFIFEQQAISSMHIVIPIYYVHQLQNLFYALTKEELTIKTDNQ